MLLPKTERQQFDYSALRKRGRGLFLGTGNTKFKVDPNCNSCMILIWRSGLWCSTKYRDNVTVQRIMSRVWQAVNQTSSWYGWQTVESDNYFEAISHTQTRTQACAHKHKKKHMYLDMLSQHTCHIPRDPRNSYFLKETAVDYHTFLFDEWFRAHNYCYMLSTGPNCSMRRALEYCYYYIPNNMLIKNESITKTISSVSVNSELTASS